MSKNMKIVLVLSAAMLSGLMLGLHAQTNSAAKLTQLSEEKAEITKMDWILLNTKVEVLQQMLKDDVSLPLAPTSFSYDAGSKKIRIAVHVAPVFLAKASTNDLSKTLESRATSLCIAPELSEANLPYLFTVQPPQDYCAVRFFTDSLSRAGEVQTKDVAIFEDGRLTVK